MPSLAGSDQELLEDVMAYKNRIDSERHKALNELAALSQELGLE